MNPLGLLILAIGVFSLGGAVFNWDWFMNHRKARFIVWVFGRSGARIFYSLLGCGLIVLGVLITIGILQDAH